MENSSVLTSVLLALIIGITNVGLGYFIARYAFHKSLNMCLGIVLGSMSARFIAVALIAWYCIGVAHFHQIGFAVTFVITTFVLLMAEIISFNNSYNGYKEYKIQHEQLRAQRLATVEIPSSIF